MMIKGIVKTKSTFRPKKLIQKSFNIKMYGKID